MGFAALILALILEQFRPLPRHSVSHRGFIGLQTLAHSYTQTGERRMAWLAWGGLMAFMVAGCFLLDWMAERISPFMEFALHVGVLYLTVGFRQFSHAFSEIQKAIAANDFDAARQTLESWLRRSNPDFTAPTGVDNTARSELCRLSIAHAMIAAHRHVLAPLLWYVLLPGFIGPVLYRCAEHLSRAWASREKASVSADHAEVAKIGYWVIDWPALRLSAASFAAMGNFEDAVYCWRQAQAAHADDPWEAQEAVLLGTGSGALGYQLNTQQTEPVGAVPDGAALQSAVGLVWRAVVLWVGVYGLMTVASWIGKIPGL